MGEYHCTTPSQLTVSLVLIIIIRTWIMHDYSHDHLDMLISWFMNLVCAVGFLKNTLLGVAHKHYYLSNCIMCKAVYIVEDAGLCILHAGSYLHNHGVLTIRGNFNDDSKHSGLLSLLSFACTKIFINFSNKFLLSCCHWLHELIKVSLLDLVELDQVELEFILIIMAHHYYKLKFNLMKWFSWIFQSSKEFKENYDHNDVIFTRTLQIGKINQYIWIFKISDITRHAHGDKW